MYKYLSFILCLTLGVIARAKDYHVSPADGEFAIEKALQQSRLDRIHEGVKDVRIILEGGTFRLCQPIIIRPEDNGTQIIGQEGTVVSGGIKIEGWKRKGKYLVAPQPLFNGKPLEFRQLYINGKKAVRARDVQDFEKMHRILSVDKQKECIYVPKVAVRGLKNLQDAEMVLHEMWCVANLRIRSIDIQGDSAAVFFHQPESHVHFMHPWPSPMVTTDGHNSAFYLMAQDCLDTHGEWWLDTRNHLVYYYPHEGETMGSVEVPAIETLFKTEGTPDRRVSNVSIESITFEESTWMRPSYQGHAPLQAGMYMIEAYKVKPKIERVDDHKLDNQGWVGRPSAAVLVNCADGIRFQQCTFRHMGATALDFHLYTKSCEVKNCLFTDISGNAILASTFGEEGHEAHLPYCPSDERVITKDLTISDCLIHDVANEDWGCVGICAGFVQGLQVLHNEIYDVSYTGISVGWGWNRQPCVMSNNQIVGNLIHHYARHMYDTAGIYTLGNQPRTVIKENVVRDIYTPGYAHDPEHWFYLYTDEGSAHITVQDNWTPSEKYLQNANGPDNTWQNNGPRVSEEIVKNAGRRK